jgi:low affinity Fe/Cu permease
MAAAGERRRVTTFDRFAEWVDRHTSRAIFFAICVGLVALWLPTYFVFGDLNTWQLVINTLTTIVTFLLVALVQNTARRTSVATHEKLDALLRALGEHQHEHIEDEVSTERKT